MLDVVCDVEALVSTRKKSGWSDTPIVFVAPPIVWTFDAGSGFHVAGADTTYTANWIYPPYWGDCFLWANISAGATVLSVVLQIDAANFRTCGEISVSTDARAFTAIGVSGACVPALAAMIGVALHVCATNAEVGFVIAQTFSLVWTHALSAAAFLDCIALVFALAAVPLICRGDDAESAYALIDRAIADDAVTVTRALVIHSVKQSPHRPF